MPLALALLQRVQLDFELGHELVAMLALALLFGWVVTYNVALAALNRGDLVAQDPKVLPAKRRSLSPSTCSARPNL
ncbi:MAG TPA: hypothetical protein VF331_19150 [Polyangiales bacterium]